NKQNTKCKYRVKDQKRQQNFLMKTHGNLAFSWRLHLALEGNTNFQIPASLALCDYVLLGISNPI
ncbi:MAG: hypothetical protein ACO28I_13635, partial [Limnohabitans sp.]